MDLNLARSAYAPPATLGILEVDGLRHSDTLERPWLDNRRMVSCIPAGRYRVALAYSDHLQRIALHVLDVPGRDGILIHPANHVSELNGCIALGRRSGPAEVLESLKAVQALEGKVRGAISRGEEIWLTVTDPKVQT